MKKVNQRRNQRGASLVEYSLLVALLALVCLASAQAVGGWSNASIAAARLGMHTHKGKCVYDPNHSWGNPESGGIPKVNCYLIND